jgi:hypothetical protein
MLSGCQLMHFCLHAKLPGKAGWIQKAGLGEVSAERVGQWGPLHEPQNRLAYLSPWGRSVVSLYEGAYFPYSWVVFR